jgi:serine/threonine protein kinase
MANQASGLKKVDIQRLLPDFSKRFTLQGRGPIGEPSGFGAVWKAKDTWLKREVAIKISKTDLSDEIRLCRDIEGQTVRIFDYFRGANGWNAYAMELLESPWVTLTSFIAKHDYNKPGNLQHYFDCFEIVYGTLRGLAEVHGRSYDRQGRYVHADIKPANLFFLCKPKKRANTVFRMPAHEDLVKIIDLGISLPRGEMNGACCPAYDFPDKLEARQGHDLYALGITFLEMLSGECPEHETMKHKARIREFVAECSSGCQFIDNLAVELARQCARAATQPNITARKLLDYLSEALFEQNPVYWLTLRSLNKTLDSGQKKDELAAHLLPNLAQHFGWKNHTAER